MIKIPALFLAFAALSSNSAVLTARSDRDRILLTQAPCTYAGVVKLLPNPAEYKAAAALLGSRTLNACWTILSEDGIGVIYEDGSQILVPMKAFRDESV